MGKPPVTASTGETVTPQEQNLAALLAGFVDPAWYIERNSDVAAAGIDPVLHFIRHGLAESRDPNPLFDSAWYLRRNPDVAGVGVNALLHYMACGATELRNPHPRFDAEYYVTEHPEAAANPLLFHLRVGAARGYLTERPFYIDNCLPSNLPASTLPADVTVDVIVPVYRGLTETKRCLDSVLADTSRPLGRVIVIDDRSPEPELVAWLRELEAARRITLLRNRRNLGFVASVNRGMEAAGGNDVVLLNSDTEVPLGWLYRLAAQAYAAPRIASVSPFSNNATICGYPDDTGGPLAFGHTLQQIDDACRAANPGRFVDLPTTVGFCMYIRRAALRDVGAFDAERFPHGYGDENDFCLRATAKGWTHRLACDVFVFHQGQVSFGDRRQKLSEQAHERILERFPTYDQDVARHVQRGAATPYRFAITTALFRLAKLPVILMVMHELGGGARRHIDDIIERTRNRARIVLLEGTQRGSALSVPELPQHPALSVPVGNNLDLEHLLRQMNVSRVHIHHVMGVDLDIRGLLRRMGLPFDCTVHDYHTICPQIYLLPWKHSYYCNEPDIGTCNTCIARSRVWARDIVTWRAEHAWIYQDAERVLCPSKDALNRLTRFGLGQRTVLAPHEPVPASAWPLRITAPPRNGKLRVAVLGTLSEHKGSRTVAGVAELMDPRRLELHVIGSIQGQIADEALQKLSITGRYKDPELAARIEAIAPHVIWFPGACPETFSYTLSAAIESGLAIAAPELGAFPERLGGRPFTWLVDCTSSPSAWIELFETIRKDLGKPSGVAAPVRSARPDFYARDYLATPAISTRGRRARPRIAIVPERHEMGHPTPCGYIRLIQPLFHPRIAQGFEVTLHNAESVLHERAEIIITQRFAPATPATTDKLIRHARKTGAKLIYDLDDDLLHIPRDHPDAKTLRPKARIAQSLLTAADAVWVSTTALAERIAALGTAAILVENRTDERIWAHEPVVPVPWHGALRILCMGTVSHTLDFRIIEPALQTLSATYGSRISIDVLGMTTEPLSGMNRIGGTPSAKRSYPGFANWLATIRPAWHVGIAPLLDTPFTRCKSPIKALDYAAMGLTVLASDTPVYRGTIADGPAGCLVPSDTGSWYAALDRMIRDRDLRQGSAERSRAAYLAHGTLAGQAPVRRDALHRCLDTHAQESAA